MYHERVEDLLAQIRIATAARKALDAGSLPKRGAVVAFPVFVTAPALRGRHCHPWSMMLSHEPGTPFPEGVTPVTYKVRMGHSVVAGTFPVSVGNAATMPGPGPTTRDRSGDQPFVGPHPIHVSPVGYSRLRAELQTLAARREDARDELIVFTRPFLVQLAARTLAGMREVSALDIDDLVQEAWPSVLRLIDQFGSARRPPTTWAAAVKRNVVRDLLRVEPKIAGVSYQVWQSRRWLDRHPDIVEPRKVAYGMTIERKPQRTPKWSPGSPMKDSEQIDIDAAVTVSERLVRQAQLIPRMVSLDVAFGPNVA